MKIPCDRDTDSLAVILGDEPVRESDEGKATLAVGACVVHADSHFHPAARHTDLEVESLLCLADR